ncbi:MAG: DUF2804 domain-containing protein [Oceanococcus sp.]
MSISSLISDAGRPQFGVFDDAVEVNIADYRHRTPLGGKAGALAQWLGYKRFQYFGILSNNILAGCALVHLRHTAVAFVYVYSPKRGMQFEKTWRLPLGIGCKMSDSAVQGLTRYQFGGTQIELGYEDHPRAKSLKINVSGKLNLEARFNETQGDFHPMSLCTRIGRNGWVYAHKVAALPVTGHIECKGRLYDLEDCRAYGHHDFSAGYMRRETFWNWACFSGESTAGRPVGLNVSCGVNETSFSENCYWLDGKMHQLGLCQFDYDWDKPMEKDWRVTSHDGRLDMVFTPQGAHLEKLNLGLIASDFKQIFGHFSGRIMGQDGQVIEVLALPGFVEDQYAKW